MADLLDEGAIGSAAAARYLREQVAKARFSPATIWRWMTTGALAADGGRIYLEHVRLGRRWLTSRPALSRFAHRLAVRGDAVPDVGRGLVVPEAKADLEEAGFYR